MSTSVDHIYLARDAYSSWKGRVQAATSSIVVFTPYLDRMLDRLLRNAPLAVSNIKVVTNLSPESGALDYRAQLIGVRALLRRGIEVRSLPRLHAKVLLCDWDSATIGSQNFTSYGRGSREATSVPSDEMKRSTFVETLEEWFREAETIDLEFIEQLLDLLKTQVMALHEAQQTLQMDFNRLWTQRQRELEELVRLRQVVRQRPSFLSQIESASRNSRERMARRSVWAHLQGAGGYFNAYYSLMVDGDSDLTRWVTQRPGQPRAITVVEPLLMHPIVLSPSGKMAFARVARTRITYLRTSVVIGEEEIAGSRFRMTVVFPQENFEASNFRVELRPTFGSSSTVLTFDLRFDGLETTVVEHRAVGSSTFPLYSENTGLHETRMHLLVDQLSQPQVLRAIAKSAFAPFRYSRLGIENHNAAEFFPEGWQSLTLIEYEGRQILAATDEAAVRP